MIVLPVQSKGLIQIPLSKCPQKLWKRQSPHNQSIRISSGKEKFFFPCLSQITSCYNKIAGKFPGKFADSAVDHRRLLYLINNNDCLPAVYKVRSIRLQYCGHAIFCLVLYISSMIRLFVTFQKIFS